MPRQVPRRYQLFFKMLQGLALDEQQPVPIRVRAAELCLAIRSGQWEVASGKVAAKAIRGIVAADAIDKELLQGIPQQATVPAETPEAPAPETTVDALLGRAYAERKQRRRLEQLRAVASDASLSPELQAAAKQQLLALGEPLEPVEQLPEQTEEERQAAASVAEVLFHLGVGKKVEAPVEQQVVAHSAKEPRGIVCPECRFQQPAGSTVCPLCRASLRKQPEPKPKPPQPTETQPERETQPSEPTELEKIQRIDVAKVSRFYDHQLAGIKEKLKQLDAERERQKENKTNDK